jgi:hypothetical protein
VPLDTLTEFPEERLSQDLMRIRSELQRGDRTDRSLDELYEALTQYDREARDGSPVPDTPAVRTPEPASGSLDAHRLTVLIAMVQETRTQLRARALNLAERIEAHEAAREAQACYGTVAQRELARPALPEVLSQS